MSGAIEIQGFSKRYGDILAVDNISLQIEAGELFGLIGPDGAGKTTTMRTLCTLLDVEAGSLRVDGLDVSTELGPIRGLLGYMPQRFSLYPDLSVEQNLSFFADLFGVPKSERAARLQRLFEFSQLEPFKRRLAGDLSGGMKQKLALSCTLIHTPRILILDEPTTGVDPISRLEFWRILRQLRDEGVTILVSTPYMDEAELCDRVAFMYGGHILALDQPRKLATYFPHELLEISGAELRSLHRYFDGSAEVVSAQIFGDRLHVSFSKETSPAERKRLIAAAPCEVAGIDKIAPSIEDVFLYLMREEAGGQQESGGAS